jgi:HD-like signal output (HDOD) protein
MERGRWGHGLKSVISLAMGLARYSDTLACKDGCHGRNTFWNTAIKFMQGRAMIA